MDNVATLENAASIAVAKLKDIKAPAEKAKAESKAAADAEAKVNAEKEKSEGIAKQKEQEAKQKEDSRILAEPDEKLGEPEKKRKAELLEAKRKEDETPEAKIKRVKDETQRRIDEIISEGKSREAKRDAELASLRAELEEQKKPKQQEDIKTQVKRQHAEQIATFVEEDKVKPKEDRREMTKDELDSWYLEDPTEATAWINRREIRRDREFSKLEEAASKKPEAINDEKRKLADDFIKKQKESQAKLISKFPSIIPSKDKIVEIRNKLGFPLDRNLNQEELGKFNQEFAEQNPEYKLLMAIIKEDKKYLESTDGPELVAAEMEKRLAKKPVGKLELTEDELNAKIEAEIQRRKLTDGEGITSTGGGKKVETTAKQKSELRQMQEKAAKKAGMSVEELDKSIDRRKGIKGANSGAADD